MLMSYGPSAQDQGRTMAAYVDQILKRPKPADLPIQQISRYELIIDLRVARELDINVPEP
jgi:putative ABC transport system substrate-binding protein